MRRHVEAELSRLGIEPSGPGFYDSPQFLAAESQEPEVLKLYGAYVATRRYERDYLSRAEHTTAEVAQFLYERLVADGRLGACIDIGMALSRFLEREGVWNCQVVGSLRMEFAEPLSKTRWIWHFRGPNSAALAGHSWLFAPPFRVLDLTVGRQSGLTPAQIATLTPFVMETHVKKGPLLLEDLGEPAFIDHYRESHGHAPSLADVLAIDDGPHFWQKRFGVVEVHRPAVRLRYVPCGTTAPAGPFESMRSLELEGLAAVELYELFKRRRQGQVRPPP